ncbi:hypothetical protein, partial [Bacteroides heparinolyticus]|uniref:hypothetical protein n=1 Tax=Prevotella heparinolytica TaxID=28113 RepID=UPI00359F4473
WVIRCLSPSCQTLVSDGSNTCLCHDKGLRLSNRGGGGRVGVKGSLLPDRCKPVHSRNIRLTGCSPNL